MKKTILLFIAIIALFGCDPTQSVDSPELREEVENRKIKQIHEPEILARALKIGGEIAQKSEMTLGKNLKEQIAKNGIEEAISFCNVNAASLIGELENKYNATIKRVSIKNRNPINKPNELEAQLLDAYMYNITVNI